jgi:hypothetical protein
MRLFIAVDLPPEVRPRIARLCQGIAGARWVRPEQLHITLRFLGDTPEEGLSAMREKLRQVALPSFSLSLTGVGVFPPAGARKPPRVLWLGLTPPAPLQSLKLAIDAVWGPVASRPASPNPPALRLRRAKPASANAYPAPPRSGGIPGQACRTVRRPLPGRGFSPVPQHAATPGGAPRNRGKLWPGMRWRSPPVGLASNVVREGAHGLDRQQ